MFYNNFKFYNMLLLKKLAKLMFKIMHKSFGFKFYLYGYILVCTQLLNCHP